MNFNFTTVFLVLCAFAVGGIAVLRPDPAVEFEARLSRLEPEDALAELRRAEGESLFHDNLELIYGRLSLADGDLDGARRSFLRLRHRAGSSEEILETLAGIEVMAGDLPKAATYLEQAHAAYPAPDRRARLAGWYRTLRMAEAETALLQSVNPTMLTAREAERLGHLLIGTGQVKPYEALLSALANSASVQNLVFKRKFLEFLIEAGREREAIDQASRWAAAEDGADTLEVSARALIGRGALDAAIHVAREGFRVAPEESHVVLPVFARSGHGGVARILQAEWLSTRTSLNDAEWETLSYLAERTGDIRNLQVALAVHGQNAIPPAIGQALLQMVRYRGAAALVPYSHLLGAETLDAVPLVGAAWAGWTGDQAATYRHLVAAAEAPLGEWDQLIWMSLLEGLRGGPFHRTLLAGTVHNRDLRTRLRDSVIPSGPANARAPG